MLTVTDNARATLAELLSGGPPGAVLRLILEAGSLNVTVDTEKPGDKTFSYEDQTVLVIDSEVSQALDERTLDVHDLEEGPTLRLL